jgi:hypothetical protein
MKRCQICGEKYSETYRECPFCEEEEALREGEEIRRNIHKGKRVAHGGRRFSLVTPTLIVLIIIMASLLIYLLRDGDGKEEEVVDTPPVEEEISGGDSVGAEEQDPAEEDTAGSMPEDGDGETTTPEETDPVDPVTPDVSTGSDYETVAKLPDGLSLSKDDFTLRELGETYTLQASGGGSTYKWYSEDDGIASVDQNGKVVAVSGGITNVLVTDGNKKAVCIVRVSASGTLTPSDSGSQSSGSALQAGDAKVINAGNGVRVRSGPGTNHEVLATLPGDANFRIVKSAGDGWFEITFDNIGGVKTTGYMKGEFLKNT